MQRPVVGVIGSGGHANANARLLGAWLAGEGVHLVTGGGSGVMSAVSEAFCRARPPARRGVIIGILPASASDRSRSPAAYPNPWVEVPVRTHLHLSGESGQSDLSRNHLVVLTSQVLVAMPGSYGTSSEVALAVKYGRPVIAFLEDGETIPALSPEIPVSADFESVKEFVLSRLGRSPRSGREP
jgi:uncharacterized protein (TIGR00725 family)